MRSMRNTLKLAIAAMAALLAACNTVPSTEIKQPLTARPVAPQPVSQADGAIFHASGNAWPLFEDRRARNVGDTLIITITETTTTSNTSASSSSQTGNFSASTPVLGGMLSTSPLSVSGGSTGTATSNGATSGSNVFTGTITVTVVEVLPNGNLVVSGEKRVAINTTDQYVRISGVVNPANIGSNNTVSSTQVGDVQLEYKSASNIDKSTIMTMLQRVFMSVLPFN